MPLILLLTAGQAPAAASQTSRSSLRVIVLEAGTTRPVPVVEITVDREERPDDPPLTAATAADGSAVFNDLPPATYQVMARTPEHLPRDGIPVAVPTGPPALSDGPSVITRDLVARVVLRAGRDTTVTFTPIRAAALRGVVVPGDWRPPERGTAVEVLRSLPGRPYRVFSLVTRRDIGADGSFLVPGLYAGEYFLRLSLPSPADHVYYPGVADPAQASPLTLSTGQSLTIAFKAPRFARGSISGRVHGLPPGTLTVFGEDLLRAMAAERRAGHNPPHLEVSWRRRDQLETGDVRAYALVPVEPDGRFEIETLASGVYAILAMVFAGSEPILARQVEVTVGGAAVGDLAIELQKPATLEGRVVASGERGTIGRFGISLYQAGEEYQRRGNTQTFDEQWSVDTTFRLTDLFGTYRASVDEPAGWRAEAVLLEDGTDILAQPYTFSPGRDYRNVKVLLTNRVVTIRGVTSLDDGTGFAIVFPENSSRRAVDHRLVKKRGIGENGTFTISSLVPGETYLVAAYPWSFPTLDEAFFVEISRTAVRVVAERPGTYEVDLRKR